MMYCLSDQENTTTTTTVQSVVITMRRATTLRAEPGRQFVRGGLLLRLLVLDDRPRLTAPGLWLLLLLLLLLLVLQTLFQFEQLPHKVEVGRYDRPGSLHHLVRVHHGDLPVAHHIRDGYGRRTGYAGLTVYEHATAGFPRAFDELERFLEVLFEVRVTVVQDGQTFVHDARSPVVHHR